MGYFDNLNAYMQPSNAPVAKQYDTTFAPFDFGNNVGRNSITATKIKNFNFNSGKGGTLTLGGNLGGTNNVNGVLSVQNTGGTEIVKLDNSGVTITNGSISIQNTSGTTILDGKGLVSTASFAFGNVTQNFSQFTTNTSVTDIPGGSLSLVLQRTANVLVNYNASGQNQAMLNGDASCNIVLDVDGANQGATLYIPGVKTGNGLNVRSITGANSVILQLSGGTHTLKLQFYADSSGTAEVDTCELNYVILGI